MLQKTGFSFKSYNTSIDEVFKKLMKDSVLKSLNIFSNSKDNFKRTPDNIKFQLSILEFWFRKFYNKQSFV